MDVNIISIQWQLFLPLVAIFPLAFRWKALRHTLQARLTDLLSWLFNVRSVSDASTLRTLAN